MPFWYYDKSELKNTPSFRDGIEPETESRYRREGARFLMECGIQMGLRHETMATGVVFYHRFYMFHSFNEFPRYVTATCCLFLAGKVEETPKKCKDIVKAAKIWLESKNMKPYADKFTDESIKEIMIHERILLQTIKFDLQVDHPYGYLLKYAKTLKGNQEQIRSMVQMAWTFINDSFCTTLCLQWEPEIIAIALMHLTSKLSKLEVTDWQSKNETKTENWWDQFVEGLRIDILEDICHQILDLYATQQAQSKGGTPTTPTNSSITSQNKSSQNNTSNNNSNTPTKKKPAPPLPPPSVPVQQPPPIPPANQIQPPDLPQTSPNSSKLTRTSYNENSYSNYQNQVSGFNSSNPNANYYQPPMPPSNMYPPMNMDHYHGLGNQNYQMNNSNSNSNNNTNGANSYQNSAHFQNQQNPQASLSRGIDPAAHHSQHHNMYPNGNGMSYYPSQQYPPPPPIQMPGSNQAPPPQVAYNNYPPNSNNSYQNRGPYNPNDQYSNNNNNNNNPYSSYTSQNQTVPIRPPPQPIQVYNGTQNRNHPNLRYN